MWCPWIARTLSSCQIRKHARHRTHDTSENPTLVRIACFTRTLAPATLHLFSPPSSHRSRRQPLHPPRSLSFSADLSLNSATLAGYFGSRRIDGEFVDLIIYSIFKVALYWFLCIYASFLCVYICIFSCSFLLLRN